MQTVRTATGAYTLKPARDAGAFLAELAKCTGKTRRATLRGDGRKYPSFTPGMSTADYVQAWRAANDKHAAPRDYFAALNAEACALPAPDVDAEPVSWRDLPDGTAQDTADGRQLARLGNMRLVLAPGRDAGALLAKMAKCNGAHKPAKIAAELRGYPVFAPGMSTADYVASFYGINGITPAGYLAPLNAEACTLYSGEDLHELVNDAPGLELAPDLSPPDLAASACPPDPLEHVEFDGYGGAWKALELGRAEPDEYRARLLAIVEDIEQREGGFYNSVVWPRAAELMAERHGYRDARAAGLDNGVERFFGSHCYMATGTIRAQRRRTANAAAAAQLHVGQRWGRLRWNDGRECTGAELLTVGVERCSLRARRGGADVTMACEPATLLAMVERAEEHRAMLAERRARRKPAVSAPAAPLPDPRPATPAAGDLAPCAIGAADAPAPLPDPVAAEPKTARRHAVRWVFRRGRGHGARGGQCSAPLVGGFSSSAAWPGGAALAAGGAAWPPDPSSTAGASGGPSDGPKGGPSARPPDPAAVELSTAPGKGGHRGIVTLLFLRSSGDRSCDPSCDSPSDRACDPPGSAPPRALPRPAAIAARTSARPWRTSVIACPDPPDLAPSACLPDPPTPPPDPLPPGVAGAIARSASSLLSAFKPASSATACSMRSSSGVGSKEPPQRLALPLPAAMRLRSLSIHASSARRATVGWYSRPSAQRTKPSIALARRRFQSARRSTRDSLKHSRSSSGSEPAGTCSHASHHRDITASARNGSFTASRQVLLRSRRPRSSGM
jgi:hypothetical protein